MSYKYWGVFCSNQHFIALWDAPNPLSPTLHGGESLTFDPDEGITCPQCAEHLLFPSSEELKWVNSPEQRELYRPRRE